MSGRIGRIGDWSNNPQDSSSRSSSTGRRLGTLNDIRSTGGPAGGASRPPPNDDDDEAPHDRREEWYAGGERSGVAIQNPNRDERIGNSPEAFGDTSRLIADLLEQARQGGAYIPPEPTGSRYFGGGGHVLGSDEVESRYIPDPDAGNQEPEEVVRHLYLWSNGFSVEDGPLMSYTDDRETLELIHSGRAPPHIMDVAYNQPVQLVIAQREGEDYVPPRRGAFLGAGNRLGAPSPSTAPPASESAMPGAFPPVAAPVAPAAPPAVEPERMTTRFEVDQTKPMTSVQVRLADGTRMVARVNLTHTVGDLRNFINASRPGTSARAYTIATPVPYHLLEDDKQTIEEAGLKNSVVVQRWV